MNEREKLIEILSKYFNIGDSDTYILTRVKEGFAVGTVTIDDFQEFDEENVADLADYLIKNNTEQVTLKLDFGDRTPEEIKQIAEMFEKATANSHTVADNEDDGFRLSLQSEREKEEIKKHVAKEILSRVDMMTVGAHRPLWLKELFKEYGVEVEE